MKTFYFILLLFLGSITNPFFAQTGIDVPEMSACDSQIQSFMSTFGIPSVSIALAKDGELKYMRSFGNWDVSNSQSTYPYHMFRIASVSKPITAVGIMKMVEDGLIALDDTVFGTGGLLENHWYFSNSTIIDNNVYSITVQQLLEHSAGWDRSVDCFPSPTSPYPWHFGGCDPIVAPLHVTEFYGESNPVKEEHLINYVLEKNLNFNPGTSYSYSNMGFLVLSEIIEEVSGMSYEAWMQQEIFHPLGIYDMYIGENLKADRKEREGEYVGNGFTTLDLYGSGNTVPWEYGGFSVNAMDGHGGWIASARDMVRLLVAVDGFPTKPDILSPTTIATMVTPSANNPNYAKGWSVNGANNWWHTGAVDGTASMWVRSNSGYTWAIVLNKRIVDGNASAFWTAVDAMGWDCIASTATFPSHDFFSAPTVNASNLFVSGDGTSEFDLSWTNGNGTSRIAVVKDITNNTDPFDFSAYPLDGVEYTGDLQFGSGDDLGDGSYVVYNGTDSNITVTNLDPSSTYAIRVYEYTKNSENGDNALYLLGNPAEKVATLSITNADLEQFITIYPTVVSEALNVNKSTSEIAEYTIYDLQGRIIKSGLVENETTAISLPSLQGGLYLISFDFEGKQLVKRFIKR